MRICCTTDLDALQECPAVLHRDCMDCVLSTFNGLGDVGGCHHIRRQDSILIGGSWLTNSIGTQHMKKDTQSTRHQVHIVDD